MFPPISEFTQPGTDTLIENEGDLGERIAESGHSYETVSLSIEEEGQYPEMRLVSTGAAARIMDVDRRTIERWVRNGQLTPAARIEDQQGKFYSAFRREDIDKLHGSRKR